PLIDCMVRLIKPQAGEVIQDPAAGTGGFLVAADRSIRQATDDLYSLNPEQSHFQRHNAFRGAELVRDTYRLCLMNLLLHGIESPIDCINSLEAVGEKMGKADLILTNPPFNRFPNRVNRPDFSITAGAAQGPIPFIEHVVRSLNPGGRAAVVLSDSVLFGDNVGQDIRRYLMDLCDLHTILRLPTGIFYAQGVKTNVLFFTRGQTNKGNTKAVWVYDMRANMNAFGKTRLLTEKDFEEFEKAYGDDPNGKAKRIDQGPDGRFRCFTRKEIADRDDNLDLSWLQDDNDEAEDTLVDPEDIAAAIMSHLRTALEEIEALTVELSPVKVDSLQEAA
ncbi:MAG: SAM-dependent methyltransferase, partial [Pedobacter sp.]